MENTHTVRWANRFVIAVVALVFGMLRASPGLGNTQTVTVLGAGEGWVYPEQGGHGIGLAALDIGELPRSAKLGLSFNTDTLRIRYGGISFADGKLQLGFFATGEAVFSGLLPDYYQLGKRDAARGFNAHYVLLGGYVKLNLTRRQSLTLEYSGRKWFFTDAKDTADALVLPNRAWVFEPRLKYTFWRLSGGPYGRQRLFRRVKGFAGGVQLGIDLRNRYRQWGAFDADAFATPDLRNQPEQVALMGYQWMKMGWQLVSRLRLQLTESAAVAKGTDDLNRYRIGGMTPYVVPIHGAPWAAFLSEQFIAGQASVHVRIFDNTEVGVAADVVYLDDVLRTGQSDAGVQAGVGAFYDMAFGPHQLDFRVGWSPTLDWQHDAGQFSLFLAYGRSWSFE